LQRFADFYVCPFHGEECRLRCGEFNSPRLEFGLYRSTNQDGMREGKIL
jgi:hypothetical protein